jgi:SAM-dependent methyltransferase
VAELDQTWDQQRVSFGAIASAYDASRPEWPASTAAWLTGTEPGGPLTDRAATSGLDVLDLAAGTGKLTRTLVAAGHRVVAADLSESMLDVLSQASPQVKTVVSKAEELPLEDDSVDVVTVAQAWHWFDQPLAARECARVLRPGGLLAVGWHQRVDGGWVEELDLLAERHRSRRTGRSQVSSLTLPAPFGALQQATFDYQLVLTGQDLVALVSTWSYVAVRPDREQVLLDAEALARREAGPDGTLTMPHLTYCYRSQLAG